MREESEVREERARSEQSAQSARVVRDLSSAKEFTKAIATAVELSGW